MPRVSNHQVRDLRRSGLILRGARYTRPQDEELPAMTGNTVTQINRVVSHRSISCSSISRKRRKMSPIQW